MGIVNKAIGAAKDTSKKPSKGKDFMNGLKEWITSPSGIVTLILFVGVIWYVHHQTAPKGAKG